MLITRCDAYDTLRSLLKPHGDFLLSLCLFEASEKMLRTWQENEEKLDGLAKVGHS